MIMYGNLIFLGFLLVLISINGQYSDDRNLPPVKQFAGRISKQQFEEQFQRGRCPHRFYQLGDECVYFSSDGKMYSWKQAERVCSRQISRLLDDQPSLNLNQPNMNPNKGVRQLILNTPEKTEILRAINRDYEEQNFAVALLSDYDTLERCNDGKDDKWPNYCQKPTNTSSTCFETISQGPNNDICLREVKCTSKNLRLACEFTLPGSSELTYSKFRNCPVARHYPRRVPIWGWIAIAFGSLVLLLIILGIIFNFVNKSRRHALLNKKTLPEPRRATEEKTVRISPKRDDQADQPMLGRAAPTNDADYLQPQPSSTDNNVNA